MNPVQVSDFDQQFPLVKALARIDLRGAFDTGRFQTSGPGLGLFLLPLYALARLVWDPVHAYGYASFLCLIPLGAATVSASRVLGVAPRSRRELANLAAVVLGLPVMAAYFEAFHPADVLAVAVCLAAFSAVARGRIGLAAVLLGFALITRQWSLVVIAVLAIGVERRARVVLVAGSLATAAAIIAPFYLANPTETIYALSAKVASRYPTTVPGLLPLGPSGRYVMSRSVPLALAALVCLWLARRVPPARPEVLIAALAVVLLLRPLVDPAGNLYYLAPGYAFAVLIRPSSWRWPAAAFLGGLAFYLRLRLLVRFPTYRSFDGGPAGLLPAGAALSVFVTALTAAAIVFALREIDRVTSPSPEPAGARSGSGGEAAAGGPPHAQTRHRDLG